MNKKILIGCFYVPGWGGPGTAGYSLFEKMQSEGLDVDYINFIYSKDFNHLTERFGKELGNPGALPRVQTFIIDEVINPSFQNKKLTALLEEISPDIILGITWQAAFLMKRAAQQIPLFFLPSGSESLKAYIRKGVINNFDEDKILSGSGLTRIEPDIIENEAVQMSDLIIAHSESILSLFRNIFPALNSKLYPEILWWAEWTCSDALRYSHYKMPFEERDIDLLFVTNDWRRPEKNSPMMVEIIKRCNGLNAHIVGEINEKPGGAVCHNFIAGREDLFRLMGRSKVLVSPSLFDASPGILYEASAMGCNLVASKNCGNWKICNENLLVGSFNVENFLEKIEMAIKRKFTDNLDFFIKSNSYEKLKKLLVSY